MFISPYYDLLCLGQMYPLGSFDVTLGNIPIVLDGVKCRGDETSLLDCGHNEFTVHDCVNAEDVVLKCAGTHYSDVYSVFIWMIPCIM